MQTKALISFAITAKLVCAFVFAYADCWFSHAAAHIVTCTFFWLTCGQKNQSHEFIAFQCLTFSKIYHILALIIVNQSMLKKFGVCFCICSYCMLALAMLGEVILRCFYLLAFVKLVITTGNICCLEVPPNQLTPPPARYSHAHPYFLRQTLCFCTCIYL